ncbi:hypothetical protein MTR_1g052955 [Medicago truncatula]|uniref:Uncharacterized protein n=1 Tax=Medicago truncatula TaxID=3880 RepID=A0A072VJ35_MEDTR|nr:hypothetical protein MTR_1g052955 [Medicago truncatula]
MEPNLSDHIKERISFIPTIRNHGRGDYLIGNQVDNDSTSEDEKGHFVADGESLSRSIGLKIESPSLNSKMDQHQQVISSKRTTLYMTYTVTDA